ncbi:MAG TPA: aquaporin [Candidatus Limnocylindrales bacterium]|nr:aquaporin [Candidatus Limnocylindrales bacterium]
MNFRALVGEAVGTFVLVGGGSLGVATALVTAQTAGFLGLFLIVPFAFGLSLMAGIAIAGDASGGHFNPAVTLAAVLDGRVSWVTGLGYAVAQAIGAFAASLFVLLTLTADVVKNTVNKPVDFGAGPDMWIRAFSIEIVLTAIFVAVILTVASKRPSQAGIIIPLTLVAIHFVGMAASGASVNPIRSLAPAVVSGSYDGLWVYLTAPFLGSIVGWALYKLLNPADEALDDEIEDGDMDDFDDEDDALEPA